MQIKKIKPILLILLVVIVASNLIINFQPSLPLGLYLKIHGRQYKKGDIVVFYLDKKYDKYYKNKKSIKYPMKRIVADNKDMITVKNNHIYVNQEDYGEILDLGTEQPVFSIEKDCFFLLSKKPHSYDSRYYGQVCRKDFKYKARLLIEM